MHRMLVALAILPLLAACSGDRTPAGDGGPVQAAPEGERAARFACDDGSSLNVQFENNRAQVTTSSGNELVLPEQVTSSGFRYSSGQHELQGKGDNATWTIAAQKTTNCRVVKSG
ncbi:Membrane-bound inhibitor of C-type lysozyme [Arboricoccus pini]|uniref:Membrane-bound inhibitor of C-type lysozyme n=1 Tax=Arboricoccus pini TaxID=1963835 RepID=A0A212PY69_9PROT|nr:MliC family protein [Arboricoccus pini]SNB51908.1 Membrane-bound inhibitor of C-type lysozyme [Arboricoccus pini]